MILRNVDTSSLPKDFIWGAGTSSMQIEGGHASGDRGRCIWDALGEVPGAIKDGTGANHRGVEHVEMLETDLNIMKELSLDSYRFSISWPRVQPTGSGAFNEKGMAFYDRLIDGLLERNIQPNITLYHWDLPEDLQSIGGWANPEVVDLFSDYSAKMSARYGDRVKYWAMINEPWCVAWLGNLTGEHAPGIRDLPTAVKVAHQLVRAHAKGSQAVKSESPHVLVGAVNNLTNPMLIGPSTVENLKDLEIVDGYKNRWWMQGMYEGKYPADLVEIFQREAGVFCDENEIGDVSYGRDWIGVNYYNADVFKGGGSGAELFPGTTSIDGAGFGKERTDMGWSWTPDGIKETLIQVSQKYPDIPIFLTENGTCYNYGPSEDGKIHDIKRDEYIARYISACVDAHKSGVNLKGYYVWSLLDNFEWAWGFEMRFGLVFVDFKNKMKRTLKESALAYRDLIRSFRS